MNAMSGSPAEAAADGPARPAAARKVLIWDAPVRVFHWLMVLSFAGAYLTAESERWRLAHLTLGYTMAGLVAFRIVWGLVGTRHARFASFVRGPSAVAAYLGGLIRGRPAPHAGHNPAGALAIVALLLLAGAVAATGWAIEVAAGGEWFGELHEGLAGLMLAVVGVHVAGVLIGSWLHRENLVRAMLTGRKAGRPEDAVRSERVGLATLMVAAVLGLWVVQWQAAPAMGAAPGGPAVEGRAGTDDDD